ncbi:MAG TPA: diacylglycerol kinase family protein [Candidatus Limnocylindrales bacterium]|nr:diacylglycerol kinase family protein [Candidatus Limnocylindrales bacterium]
MDEGRVALIVNPTSGGGRGWRVLGEAAPLLRSHGLHPDVVVCTNGDEPATLARQAVDAGHRRVVAVGGDGQAAAVANGLIGSDAALAVLPAGSANDYARTIGIPRGNVAAAVETIAADNRERVDTVRVSVADGERHFLNVVGTGFDAVVAARAERIPVLRGAGRYVLAIVAELPRFSAATITLTVDGERLQLRAMMVALANGSTYGGGMRVAPSASLTSGRLEICIVGELSTVEFMRAFPRVFRGTHVDHPAVTMLSGREVHIDADRPLRLIGDGDLFGQLPATVAIRPASLEVVVGPGFAVAADGPTPKVLRRPD